MRRLLLLAALLAVDAPVCAQSQPRADWCEADNVTDDQTIAGCTLIISSPKTRSDSKLNAAYTNRAVAYANKKMLDKAVADYTQAIRLQSNDFQSLNNRANAYMDLGNTRLGLDGANKALAANDRYPFGYATRARAYYMMGAYAKALPDIQKAIALKPKRIFFINRRAEIFEKLGHKDAAVRDYRAVVKAGYQATDKATVDGAKQGLVRLGATSR